MHLSASGRDVKVRKMGVGVMGLTGIKNGSKWRVDIDEAGEGGAG